MRERRLQRNDVLDRDRTAAPAPAPGRSAETHWIFVTRWFDAKSPVALSIAEQVAASIGDRIIADIYQPGARITEQEIAGEFQVSRGPVRDAFRILEREGLARLHRNRGLQVTKLSTDEVRDLFEIRAALYAVVAERSARNPQPGTLRRMNELIAELGTCLDANDGDRYAEISFRLSLTWARGSGSERLSEMVAALSLQTLRYSKLSLRSRKRRRESITFWRAARKAIAAGDVASATRLAADLIRTSRDEAMRSLGEGKPGLIVAQPDGVKDMSCPPSQHDENGNRRSGRTTRVTKPTKAILRAAALLGCTVLPVASRADDPIVLRFADDIPKTHPISVYGSKVWMDEVEKLTSGKVKFQWYPSGQLGKGRDVLALVQSGAIDVGSIGPSYTPEKLPLSAVAELPGMFASSCAGSQAAWKLMRNGGLLDQKEYAPLGLHVVFAFTNPPYEVQTVKRDVAMPADMKGLRLKTLGGASDDAALKLGAVPVQMAVPDLFLGLQCGTVDGRFGAFTSVYANSTQDVLSRSTLGAEIGGFVLGTFIGDRRWKSLPADVQDAMLQAGDVAQKRFCAEADKENAEQAKALTEKNHWVVHTLTADEKAAWQAQLASVATDWAKRLDGRGKAGTGVLDAFRAAVR